MSAAVPASSPPPAGSRPRHLLDLLGTLVADEDNNGVDVHVVQPFNGVRGDVQKTVPVLKDSGRE